MRDSAYKFSDPFVAEGRIELVTENGLDQAAELIAYVNGIEIGRSAKTTHLPGARATINCNRFPHVNLPVILRFALGEGGLDAAPPLTISSPLEVVRLVGIGAVVNTSLRIADGVLHGTAYNAENGVSQPALIGRINGLIMRPIQCERMVLRDEGGGRFVYHMRLLPEDLQATGALFEIVSLPGFETIASISYERNEGLGIAAALPKIEAAVAMLGKRLDLEVTRNGHAIDAVRKQVTSRDDALVEYVMAIALDAGTQEESRHVSIPPRPEWGMSRAARTLRIPPASRWFISGWGDALSEFQGLTCCLVDGCGVLLNPHTERGLARLQFTVLTDAKVCPPIEILFDSKQVPISIVDSNGHGPFSISAELETPSSVTLIRILINGDTSGDAPSPIANVTIDYDTEDAATAPK